MNTENIKIKYIYSYEYTWNILNTQRIQRCILGTMNILWIYYEYTKNTKSNMYSYIEYTKYTIFWYIHLNIPEYTMNIPRIYQEYKNTPIGYSTIFDSF